MYSKLQPLNNFFRAIEISEKSEIITILKTWKCIIYKIIYICINNNSVKIKVLKIKKIYKEIEKQLEGHFYEKLYCMDCPKLAPYFGGSMENFFP